MVATASPQFLRKVIGEVIDHHEAIQTMKSDITELKQDVAVLKQDVAVLKQDVAVLKQDVAMLKAEMHRQGLIQEEIRDIVKTIVEVVSPLLKKTEAMVDFNQTLIDHKDQIKFTQTALIDHIHDKTIHRFKI